jgi:hypothetical protein
MALKLTNIASGKDPSGYTEQCGESYRVVNNTSMPDRLFVCAL